MITALFSITANLGQTQKGMRIGTSPLRISTFVGDGLAQGFAGLTFVGIGTSAR